ncbi:unnamed protein product [Urochloa humidicola]
MAADIAVISSPPCAPPPANPAPPAIRADPVPLFSSDVLLRKTTSPSASPPRRRPPTSRCAPTPTCSSSPGWWRSPSAIRGSGGPPPHPHGHGRLQLSAAAAAHHHLLPAQLLRLQGPPASLQLLLDSHAYWADQGRHYGIAASRDDGEFVAAAFRAAVACADEIEQAWEEVWELSLFSSSTGQWEIIELDMPFDAERGLYLLTWETDKAFSVGGGFMCFSWITTAASSVLYCDVLADCPELTFVPLPGVEI